VDRSLLTDGDLGLRPGRGRRSPWLREALADEGDPAPAPPLRGRFVADVAIVGGGYTGLWTAWHLLGRDPALRIVILDADICGGGPSGRNGGFVNSWWDEASGLVEAFGEDGARACLVESAASVHAIGAWCEAHGVDAHYRRGGMLVVSTTPAHDGRWTADVAAARGLGDPDAFRELSADEMARRCRSPRFRGGAVMRDGATVHPARLVRGLRRACLDRGVAIHEGTRVTRVRDASGGRLRVMTDGGEVLARHVVLAVNAWAAGWPGARSRVLAWGSYMVRSEPIPDLVAGELAWIGGESIVDARFSVHYLHVTREGRIAIGAGGGRPGLGGRIGPTFTDDVGSALRAAFAFRWLFPQLREVRLTDAWGGPIDVSPDHLPHVWSMRRGRLHVAAGYSGNGVGPSHLVGRILAALALGSDEGITRLPIVGRPWPPFPPEPLRYLGARVLREAMIRREDAEEAGRRPGFVLRQLSRLPRRLGYQLGPGG
jgi:glycine/D-amino acid oxidase-like deaminating enzyme